MSSSQFTESFNSDTEDELAPLRCWECNVNFTTKHFLYAHLFHHIRQPYIVLDRVQLPPLKITLKSKSDNSFEIVHSPHLQESPRRQSDADNSIFHQDSTNELPQIKVNKSNSDILSSQLSVHSSNSVKASGNLAVIKEDVEEASDRTASDNLETEEIATIEDNGEAQSPEFSSVDEVQESPTASDSGCQSTEKSINSTPIDNSNSESNTSDYGSIPGAEPTPPPEPAVEYPKIRIKTTGLLKEPSSVTITEITDDNPDGDPNYTGDFSFPDQTQDASNLWTSSNLEDPLKLPENDDSNILSLFNNNERAKDLGFHSSDSEFISLDRLEDRNRGAMQLYNSSNQGSSNPLDSLTGLPMQALAQQVSRLQSTSNGMHQQNVLINIQQFPSGPPTQPAYQPPPMYPYPQQPMHHPYQYQQPYRPPYYPPGPPGYPPQHMPPPPQPPMTQMGQPPMNQPPMNQPPMSQPQMNQNQMPPSSQPQNINPPMQQQNTPYRQPMPPRQPIPRQQQPPPGNRIPNGTRPPMGQRQPMTRPRAPMMRPRSAAGMTAVRSVRPRMSIPQNGVRPQNSPIKRTPEQMQQLQAKKKRFDLLTPDKDDDDCQVICMQPKNTDGGLPQIESVQGGTSEPAESSIMHLSDSITLSVRNPPPKPVEQPKKSDAKAVANILATRGITVTATAKPKEKPEPPQKSASAAPASLNLNGAVSIIPAAKGNGNSPNKPASSEALPTVDLTDDSPAPAQPPGTPQKQRPGLPFRCDLCPAQYPNAVGLNKHRQTYHKTTSGMAELGIPVINLKTPGVMQKMTAMGISNYIPLPSQGAEGTFVVPIINSRNPANLSNIGSTTMISLGPIRSIPRPQNNNAKQMNNVSK